jgi:hypothetical protein
MERVYAILFATLVGVSLTAIGFSAVAGDRDDRDDRDEEEFEANLRGFQEVPAISTTGRGRFTAELSEDRMSLTYRLTFSGLTGDVRQAHIHLGQRGVNGGISVWLCETNASADSFAEGVPGDAPTCPQSGTVRGTLSAINVIGPAGQGIAAGEFGELVVALRAEVTYANVHSSLYPGGEIRGQIERD